MTRMFVFLSLVLVLGWTACTADKTEDTSAVTCDPVETCYALAEKLELYGFDRNKPACKLRVAHSGYDDLRLTDTWDVASRDYDHDTVEGLRDEVVGSLWWFVVDQATGEVVGISNDYARLLAREQPEKAPHTWSQERVLEKAKQYIMAVCLDTPELVTTRARFDSKHNSSVMSWRATLHRKHAGYPLKEDRITLYVHEEYGLVGYAKWFFSEPGPAEEKVKRGDAKKEAERQLKELLRRAGVKPDKDLLNIECQWSATLYVNPQLHRDKAKRVEKMTEKNAVLAHEFDFVVTVYDREPELHATWKNVVDICIDAATGEYLCADYNY